MSALLEGVLRCKSSGNPLL